MAEPGIVIYWFGADLYYPNANHFAEQVRKLIADSPTPVKWLVVDAGAITDVDYTAAGAVGVLQEGLAREDATLALAHVSTGLRATLDRLGLTSEIGANRLFDTLRDSLAAFHAESSGKQ
jgi:SulP family sulfate permease